jgi:hypothetical protein
MTVGMVHVTNIPAGVITLRAGMMSHVATRAVTGLVRGEKFEDVMTSSSSAPAAPADK